MSQDFIEGGFANKNGELSDSFYGLFVAYLAKTQGISLSLDLQNIISKLDIDSELKKNYLFQKCKDFLSNNLSCYSELPDFVFKRFLEEAYVEIHCNWFKRGAIVPPINSYTNLICRLFDFEEADTFVDINSDSENLISSIQHDYEIKEVLSLCSNTEILLLNTLYSMVYDDRIKTQFQKGFNKLNCIGKKSKIYCSLAAYPLKVNELDLPDDNYFKKGFTSIPASYAYAVTAINILTEKGKCICSVPDGVLFNNEANNNCLKYFIDNGYLEAIISMPAKMYTPTTNIKTSLLVLSKNNKKITFVNASNMYSVTRSSRCELSEENINMIYSSLYEENEYSKTIEYDIIKENKYSCYINDYFFEPSIKLPQFTAYRKLSEVLIKSPFRGFQIKAEQLDMIETDINTKICYLTLKNINNNKIDDELINLTEIPDNLSKGILKKNDVILSMNIGDTLKVAIVYDNDRKIIPASNLYVLRCDESIIDPVFLKILLESKVAFSIFNAFKVGSTVTSISADLLNKIQIPVPPLSEQQIVVKKYLIMQEEINSLSNKMKEIQKQQNRLLETNNI